VTTQYVDRILQAYPELRDTRLWRVEDEGRQLSSAYLLDRIREDFPGIGCKSYRRFKASNDFVVLVLDGKFVFRFIQGNELEDLVIVLREQAIVDRLRDCLSVPVPDFQFRPPSLDYIGYSLLPGTLLSPWRFERQSRSNKRLLAARMSQFLAQVHSLPMSEAHEFGVEEEADQGYESRAASYFEEHEAWFSIDERHTISRWLKEFEHPKPDPCLSFVHSDIYPYHLMHDPVSGQFTGVIDWADHCITDRAKDFSGLWFYGEEFVDAVIADYPQADSTLKERSLRMFKALVICCAPVGRRDPVWEYPLRVFRDW
jgi:aminoglycoside phosphotransferase (APT) family kinase protein